MATGQQMRLMGLGSAVKSMKHAEHHFNPASCFADRLQKERKRLKKILNAIRMNEVPFSVAGTKIALLCSRILR